MTVDLKTVESLEEVQSNNATTIEVVKGFTSFISEMTTAMVAGMKSDNDVTMSRHLNERAVTELQKEKEKTRQLELQVRLAELANPAAI